MSAQYLHDALLKKIDWDISVIEEKLMEIQNQQLETCWISIFTPG